MKFDYRGIVLKIKTTLEQIYRRANCRSEFFVLMIVFDTRIEQADCSEYLANDVIRLACTEKAHAVSAQTMIDASPLRPKPGGRLTVKDLYKIFKGYCQNISCPILSDIYPVYESDAFKADSPYPFESGFGSAQDDSYFKGVIAICAITGQINQDDFIAKTLPGFGGNFYEMVTREYLRHFATGVVNNAVSQAASLPANIVTVAGVKYVNFWGKSISKAGGYGRGDDFVDNINKIAELAYESAEACGRIIFCGEEFPDEYALLKFKTPYKLSNHTLVRKLLQIVDMGHCLGATGDSIYGIISDRQAEEYRLRQQALFSVNFKRERMWEINYLGNMSHNPVKIFVSEYEAYKYAEEKLNRGLVAETFAEFAGEHMTAIFEIISSAIDGRHGTMIVFSKDAESETRRLKNTCIQLKTPIDLGNGENRELVKFITSIDGAVLCDEAGICYAIGVILDGFTSPDDDSAEDISRGARHNSAHRYLRGHKGRCVMMVISEDGDLSVIS